MSTQVVRQQEVGRFRGAWRRLDLPSVAVTDERISHGVYNSAAIARDCAVVFIPVQQPGSLIFEGHSREARNIYLVRQETMPVLSLPSRFRSFTVEFNLHQLQRMAQAMGISLPPRNSEMEIIAGNAPHAAALSVIQGAISNDRITPQERSDALLSGWLRFACSVSGQAIPVDRSSLSQRRRAALDAADYMLTNIGTEVSLVNLCELTGVSLRSLRNGFQDVFGVSPKRWLKRARLSAARSDLRSADPDGESVSTIASRHGFTQFSHFATDYRKQFGEQPSETLRR